MKGKQKEKRDETTENRASTYIYIDLFELILLQRRVTNHAKIVRKVNNKNKI